MMDSEGKKAISIILQIISVLYAMVDNGKDIDGNKLAEEILNFKLDNDSPELSARCNYFSAYKGAIIIRYVNKPIETMNAYTIGHTIFLMPENDDPTTIMHEYGHTVEFDLMGRDTYEMFVMLPSVVSNRLELANKINWNYYDMPWERLADYFGKVPEKERNYKFSGNMTIARMYLFFTLTQRSISSGRECLY